LENIVGGPIQYRRHVFSITQNDLYIVSSSGNNVLIFRNRDRSLIPTEVYNPTTDEDIPTALCFDKEDYNRILIGKKDGTISSRNVSDKSIQLQDAHEGAITHITFLNKKGAKVILTCSSLGELSLWSVTKNLVFSILKSLKLPNAEDTYAATNPDGSGHRYFLVYQQNFLGIFDYKFQIIKEKAYHNISAVSYSHDGKYIIVALRNSIIVLNPDNLEEICKMNHKEGDITCLSPHPELNQIVFGTDRGNIFLCDYQVPMWRISVLLFCFINSNKVYKYYYIS